VVELEIPARPEFVGIARMFVSALAGVRPGLAYERVDDLRIVVSEACTGAIEAMTADGDDGDGCRLVESVCNLEVIKMRKQKWS